MPELDIQHWGTIEYPLGLERMRDLNARVSSGLFPSTLVVCNHPPVFTAGRRFDRTQILGEAHSQSASIETIGGIPLIQTERGGLLTYHDTGQIILYPIIRLRGGRGMFRRIITALEETTIQFLGGFNIKASRREGQPGVFCDKGKIASIGLAVKHQTTMHGLAVNISANVENFNLIAACGVAGQPIANLCDFAPVPDNPLGLADKLISLCRDWSELDSSNQPSKSQRPA